MRRVTLSHFKMFKVIGELWLWMKCVWGQIRDEYIGRGWNLCIWGCDKVVRLFGKSIYVFKQQVVGKKYPHFLKYQSFYISQWVCSSWPKEQNWAFMFLIVNFHWATATLCSIHRKPHSSWPSSFHLDRRPHSGPGNSKKVPLHNHS